MPPQFPKSKRVPFPQLTLKIFKADLFETGKAFKKPKRVINAMIEEEIMSNGVTAKLNSRFSANTVMT